MGLLDFFQGASNAAAGNVSGPVDAIAWALRKAGVPVGDAPMGSSQWMAQMGLTRPANGYAGLLGEAAGLSMPIVAAAKAPQIARGLLSLDDKAMDMARQGVERAMLANGGIQPATVWHGSPHNFDKFDASKIGTGEGAQAYGHGLYLAESPEVAGSYKAALSGRGDAAGAVAKHVPARQFTSDEIAAIHRAATGDDPIEVAARRLGYRQASLRGVDEAALTRAIADVRDQAHGSLYKVDLPDEKIARMLDWDKPLSQQPKAVRDAFEPMVAPIRAEMAKPANPGWGDLAAPTNFDPSGQELLGLLRNRDANLTAQQFLGNGLGPDVSRNLLQKGIPGIRYLDGGSRVAGTGTSNYVIFPGNENMLTILERNGQPVSNLGLGK